MIIIDCLYITENMIHISLHLLSCLGNTKKYATFSIPCFIICSFNENIFSDISFEPGARFLQKQCLTVCL